MFKVLNGSVENTFDDITKFYDWLLKNKDLDNLVVQNKEALDIYNFFKFYLSIKNQFEREISKTNSNFIDNADNDIVKTSINELIRMNADGKYLRAMLIALGYLIKNNNNDYLALAMAYETFQTAILIHDDIIDNASIRRGKETIPESYKQKLESLSDNSTGFNIKKEHISNSMGICVGDLGFYLANKIIIDNYSNSPALCKVLSLYNKIVINTIKGEIIDVLLPFSEQYRRGTSTEENVIEIYKLKTAWYTIIGPFSLGMTLADFTDEQIKQMEDILYNLGIAFQIKDDILGIFGNEVELGKSASSDVSEFKQTILYTYVSNKSKEQLTELSKYYGKQNLTQENLNSVKQIFISTGALEYANNVMNKMFLDAKAELEKIDFISEDKKSILNGFITYLNLRNK